MGAAIPVGDLTDDPGLNQTAGLGAAGALMYTFDPNLTVYGEAAAQWFTCDGCNTDASTWGLDGGLKYVLADQGAAFPWIGAGVADELTVSYVTIDLGAHWHLYE